MMRPVPGGEFLMGSAEYPEEGPVRQVRVEPFLIDEFTVSNAEFDRFVTAAGHRTGAEQHGGSFVFAGLLPDDFPPTRGVTAAPWWREVEGAHWRCPEGPHSTVDGREDHPVVHVDLYDAQAYCRWSGDRLAAEPEWEHAARGGRSGSLYPWGDELEPDGEHRMNVWQGDFPSHNTEADGWYGTCPVDAFPPNGFGLYNMTGNVWEWCDSAFDGEQVVTKGGSYLCHASHCRRYRPAARQGLAPDTTTGNLGFRVARHSVATAS